MTSRTRNSNRKPAPAPHPTPEPAESPTSPLFLQPPEDLADPMPAATMTDSSSPLPPSSSSSPNGAGDAGSVSPFGTPSIADPSEKADPGLPKQKRFTKAALRGYATKAVKYAGALVAGALTHPDSIERAAGLWQLDDDDVRDISDPVAGLVARRMPSKAGGALNPDVEDGFMLALALAAYVGKQLQRKAELRALYVDQGPQDMTEPEGVAV